MDRLARTESESRFSAYVEGLVGAIGHADRAAPLRDYCLGLLMPGERKSVEPMAAVTAPARVPAQHQSLLHFVGNAPWSVLLRHKRCRVLVDPRGALQHGHRSRLLARATVRRRRMVAIEFGMCRSGRIGGASGSVTWGNGRFLEVRGGARS